MNCNKIDQKIQKLKVPSQTQPPNQSETNMVDFFANISQKINSKNRLQQFLIDIIKSQINTSLIFINMNKKEFIDLAELVEDITKVVVKSSFIIKEISQNFTQVFYKDDNYDPVTQADYLVQQTITDFIRSKYPGLKIVGQENTQADDDICKKVAEKAKIMNFSKLNPNKLVQKYPIQKNQHWVKKQNLCLWIDPLDCTRGFVSNRKQQVTILVGITQNHKPIAGIIGQPFKIKNQNQCIFSPHVFIGSQYFVFHHESKYCYEYNYFKKEWKKWQEFNSQKHGDTQRKVAISSRRVPTKQHSLMEKVKMEKHQIGGAGSKFIKLIKKQVGTLMFIDARTSKWDSCAGQAIIKAMGGFSIKPNLEQIVYDPNQEYINNQGFISSLSHNVFKEIQEYISTEDFQNCGSPSKQQMELESC